MKEVRLMFSTCYIINRTGIIRTRSYFGIGVREYDAYVDVG